MNTIFKTTSPIIFGLIFGGVSMIMGLVFLMMGLLTGSYAWVFGVIALVLAIAIPVGAYFFGTQEIIECSEEGFTLERQNKRKGNTKEFFPWGRVTATNYYEIYRRRTKNRPSSYDPNFEVHSDGGLVMKLGAISKLSNLIKIFNEKTPQLPYTWEPQVGFNFNLGKRSEAFIMVPRAGVASPSGQKKPPPPLPGSAVDTPALSGAERGATLSSVSGEAPVRTNEAPATAEAPLAASPPTEQPTPENSEPVVRTGPPPLPNS